MPMICVHGLGQEPVSWNKTLAALGEGARARCPDLAGMLKGRRAEYQSLYHTFEAYCEESSGPLDLCGLSLGAVLALHYGMEHPEKVASLALVAPQYKMPRRLLAVQNAVFRLMPARMFRGMGLSKAEVILLCRTMAELDLSGGLGRIACPVLLLCGEKDRANQRAAAELAGRIPGAMLRIVPGAGHEVNVEAPGALAGALHDFYGKSFEKAGPVGQIEA